MPCTCPFIQQDICKQWQIIMGYLHVHVIAIVRICTQIDRHTCIQTFIITIYVHLYSRTCHAYTYTYTPSHPHTCTPSHAHSLSTHALAPHSLNYHSSSTQSPVQCGIQIRTYILEGTNYVPQLRAHISLFALKAYCMLLSGIFMFVRNSVHSYFLVAHFCVG